MKRFALLFLALAAIAHAGDPPKIESEVKAKPGRLLKLSASAPTAIKWINTSDTADLIPDSNGKSAIFFPTVPGRYKIAVYTADAKDGPSEPAYCTVIVEGDTPGPKPDPDPPGPKPDPAPIPLAGFRAMIVEESADRAKLPAGQVAIITGQTTRKYLNDKCVIGTDGKTREWWILDKDADVSGIAKHWQDAFKRQEGNRKSLPWVILSNGKIGYEGPLPADPAAMLELMKKYGG